MPLRPIAALAATLVCSAAQADEGPPDSELSIEEETGGPDWAIAVEVGLLGSGGGLAGSSGGYGVALAPGLSGSLERRLGDAAWLMLDAGLLLESQNGEASLRSWSSFGAIGLRHALTSPEIIEVSWYGRLDGGYASYSHPQNQAVSWYAGASTGIVLDKAFTDWFGIRLRTSLFRVGYARIDVADSSGVLKQDGWGAALDVAPTFALRFAF